MRRAAKTQSLASPPTRLALCGASTTALSTSCHRLLSLPEYSTGFLGAARLYRKDDSSPGALGAADAGDAGDVDRLLVQVRESQPNKGFVTPPSFFSTEWSHENASPRGEPGTVPDSARSAASSPSSGSRRNVILVFRLAITVSTTVNTDSRTTVTFVMKLLLLL